MKDLNKIQEYLESTGYAQGVERYNKNAMSGLNTYGSHLYQTYVNQLMTGLKEWLDTSCPVGKRAHVKAYLRNLEPYWAEVCAVACKKAWKAADVRNRVATAAHSIGTAVSNEYLYQLLREQAPTWALIMDTRLKQAKAWEAHKIIHDTADKRHITAPNVDVHVGMVIIDVMVRAGLFQFETLHKSKNNTLQLLTFTPEAKKYLDDQRAEKELLSPVYPPMVVEPEDWSTVIGGGYKFKLRDKLMLFREGTVPLQHLDKLHSMRGSLAPIFDVINTIQKTPYRINKDILQVIEALEREDSGHLGGIPISTPFAYPPKPPEDCPASSLKFWRLEMSNIRDTNEALESKRRAFLATLGCARAWQDFEKIYFPCTLDWRWRIYPIGLPLNPQGDSVSKALLEFAEGEPVDTPEAWDSLYITGANIWGNDKVSIQDRITWVEDNLERILASADDPLVNLWWTGADKPLHFLAWCMSISKLNRGESLCHFICSVDGSQNGIQHYALLGRCQDTARAVNVISSDKPNDLYTGVRDYVANIIDTELLNYPDLKDEEVEEKGYRSMNNFRIKLMAEDKPVPEDLTRRCKGVERWLELLKAKRELDRALVKRPVMTYSYSVTYFGIQDQLIGELKQRLIDRKLNFDKHWIPKVARLLTPMILEGIQHTVKSAADIMRWLKDLAAESLATKDTVEWTTPLGIPIQQRYMKQRSKRLKLLSGDTWIRFTTKESERKPDKVKAANGIAPNIIHSLDSDHLKLTVMKAKAKGVSSFCMVHDSFGVHARYLPLLNRSLREAAVEIYTQPVLNNIGKCLSGRDVEFPMGKLDVTEVLKSDYFFC